MTALPESSTNTIYPPLAGQVIVLTGATASGKSDAAVQLAETIQTDRFNGGEILSLDALAVYRGMNIGTAKPDAKALARVPHHMIDLVDPDEEFSVAEYLRMAHRVVREIRGRGRMPIFVGGTPMYLKAILRGFDPGPPADPTFRESVEADVKQYGHEALHQRLAQVDPLSAHRIDATDVRRMIRALEVAHVTGLPISHRQKQFDRPTALDRPAAFAIRWPRAVLHDRINARVESMFNIGLVDEILGLQKTFRTFSKTAAQAVGYREVIEMLSSDPEASQPTAEQLRICREEVAAHTRQLARRQETWFRSFEEIQFIDVEDDAMVMPILQAHFE